MFSKSCLFPIAEAVSYKGIAEAIGLDAYDAHQLG
jgi:hypothetical protein